MEELDGFNSLDPLGPEYGKINQPLIDEKGFSAFEGDKIQMPKADLSEPRSYYPAIPGVGNLNRPNRPIVDNHVKTSAVNPSIPQKPINANEYKASNMQKLDAFFQSNQDKNNYAKIYSYNAGPDGNAFYKRYAAYGQEKFDEVGFSPLRDNEANFNARTTRWDDFSRMMTHSFIPLFTRGFVSGPKSLGKMLKGDFTSADLEDARVYEEAAAIGQSNKGGLFGFANNAMMNFGYTAGIITEAIAEEAAGALLAAPTGGSSLFFTTANNFLKFPKLFKGLNAFKAGKRGYQAVKDTLRLTDTMADARKFWQGAKDTALGNFAGAAARGLNPLENTVDAVKRIRQADNITDLAILSKTAGGFYRDVRKINMALSEARLEAGMVENNVFDKLYNEAYKANDNQVPSDKELAELEKQAKDASYETLLENAALVYASNAITFNNITSPKGGLRNFIKSTTDDIAEITAREGEKNFGKIGKVIYDRAAKKFAIEKNDLKTLAKGWLKNPVYKSVGKTVGYFKANFTEGIQENLQETIAEANEKYFIDSYKSPTLQSMLYSRAATRAINRNKLDYFSDSWERQNPFTAQGFETFASGFFMGTLAGPLNNAVPFLSSTYNRMFNKEQYEKWKTGQMKTAENLVKELNDMSLKAFMGDNIQNLGAQDLLATVKNTGSKKEAMDAENEIFVSQVRYLKSKGLFGTFTQQLEDLKEMTDKEFADAVKITESEVPKYRGRVDSSVERLNKIKNLYDRVERKNPNPVKGDIDLSNPDNFDKAFLKAAWDKNNENMVFFNEVYDNALGRRAAIEKKYNSNPKYKSIDNRQRNLLFRPEDMADELDILDKELQAEKELGTNANKIKQLEDKIKITKNYQENFRIFDTFFNRSNYAEVIGEQYKKEFDKEASPEELVEYMDQKLGSLDNENLKVGILERLKDSHKNYLKTLAQQKGDYVFDADTDETFLLLADYYKLGHETKQITKYIEALNDPDAFLDVLRRNMAWMKNQHAKRVKYFEEVVTSEMDKVRNNAFLNELANKGYYMSREDMDAYFTDGMPPNEIFNNITKEVYEKGSDQYKEIYQEFFEKREELKSQLNPRKTGIIDSAYQSDIDKLIAERDEKINQLPKTETRVELGEIVKKGKNKTFNINELVDQLNPNEYVEVKVKGTDETLFPQIYFMDENGDLHFDNIEGEFVETSKVKDRYTEGKKFTLEMRPDPAEVEKINAKYTEKINEKEEAYAEEKSNIELEVPYEDVTPTSNLSTPDLQEFRKDLYQAYQDTYVANLSDDQQNDLANDSELDNETFEKWYSMPQNRKYFDDYNKQNRPDTSKAEVVITYKGLDIDTKSKSLDQLVKYRDQINNDATRYAEIINGLPSDQKENIKKNKNELKELKKTLKALNNVIALRQFNKFPKSVQESVSAIQKVIKAQKDVVPDSMVTEFDDVTALKPGQRSYKINGEFYRRVTNAMQDVLGKKYVYRGEQVVLKAFDSTIGQLGLNDKSIDAFLSLIKANLDSDSDSLPGTNDILLFSNEKNPKNLEDTLKALSGLSPEQIKIERDKNAVLDKIEDLNKKIYDIEDSEEVNESKLNTYRNQREELYKKVVEIEAKLRGVPATTAPVSTDAKADLERRRQEDINKEKNKIANNTDVSEYNKIDLSGYFNVGYDMSEAEKNQGLSDDIELFVENYDSFTDKNYEDYMKTQGHTLFAWAYRNNLKGLKQGVQLYKKLKESVEKINAKYDAKLAALGTKDTKADVERRYDEEIKIALNKEINDSFTPVQVGPKNEARSAEEAILNTTNFLKETFNWPQVEISINSEENSFTFIVNGTEFKVDGSIGFSSRDGVTTVSLPFRLKDIVNEKYQAELDALEGGVSEEVTINDISTTQSNINDVQTLDGKYWVPKKVFEEAYKNDTGNRGQQTLDSIISRGGYSVKELDKLLPNWKELTVELNKGKATPTSTDLEDSATKNNTTKDIITQFFRENTYQDGRDAGNFFDLAKDYLETGMAPAFDESIITREAYDNLFNENTGYLTDIKRRVDAGEFYLVGRDIVVWKEIIKDDATIDRIAGEIDLVLANENGIFVVDIKSGEESKFLGFNSLSTTKELYSKRNDYTLQTSIYATMLEDMIDKKVAGIAMLPIQRVSNKNTNQVVDAGKPTAKSIYNKVIYKYDSKGNPILNKFGEKEFQQTQQAFEIDFLVPLDRNSVKNEIDQLLPKSKKQVSVNSKAAAERKFKIYRYSLDEITNENTAQNRQSLKDLEELIEKFANENSVTVPQDLLNAIEAKRNSFKTLQNIEVLDGTISKYKKLSKNSAARVDDINKLLDETKSELSFKGIDLRDDSPFVKNQLASGDEQFIEYFNKHNTYKNSKALPTVGQINAIQAMLRSGLIDSVEIDDIVTMANASEIIHDGVIRIQYLKVNSDTNAEAKKLAEYQKTIFTLINLTRDIETNQAIANTLESALKDAKNNEVAKAVKNLDLEILSTQNQIDGKFTTDYQRKKLTERLQDLVNFKETLASAYAFIPADVGADIADQKVNEEEGEILLFEIPTVKEKLAIGDIVYSKKRNNNKKYTVTNVTDKNVMLVDENNKKSTVKIDTFDNNYYTSKEMNTGKPDTGYELEDAEKNIINQSQETVDGFMKDTAALDKAKSESDKKKQSDIENDLINQIKSCQ
jgi:hypothetical protein